MLVVLTLRHAPGRPQNESPIDGAELLALLPKQWRKNFREGTGFIAIRIETDENITTAQIRAQVVSVLANPEITQWRLVSCETLTHPRRDNRRINRAAAVRRVPQHAEWN